MDHERSSGGIRGYGPLFDGRIGSLRCLGADDAEAVIALHQHLSDHDRYFRFYTQQPVRLDGLVARVARAHGIGRFIADVLGENHLMLMVGFDLGWRCEPADYESVRHLEIELPDFVVEAPTSAHELS